MNEHDATELAFKNGYKNGAADAVRKFAERLKTYYNNLVGTTSPILTSYHIDQIANEMLEGGDTNDIGGTR